MRIAMLSPELGEVPGQPLGGVAAATEWLIRGLLMVEPSLEIHVLRVPSEREGSQDAWGDLPVHIHHMKRSRWDNQLGILKTRDVDDILTRIDPHVIHVQGHASALDGKKHRAVLTIHGIPEKDTFLRGGPLAWLKSRFVGFREGVSRHRYPHLITIADAVLEGIEPSRFEHIHRIPNAISQGCFEPVERVETSRPVVLQVGRIIRGKNLLGLVEALGVLKDDGVPFELHVAGPKQDGEYSRKVDERMAELGLISQVKWLGPLSHAQLREALRRARVLALPSFQEMAPICIAEAQAMGVPVVASRVGGIPEMITVGETGDLIDPHAVGDIVRALRPYLMNEDLALKQGQAARQRASQYAPVSVAEATLKVYEYLANR